MDLDLERRLAIAELLAQSDPPELPRRSHRVRVHGKPDRYALVAQLSAVFVQRKLLALEERREMNDANDRGGEIFLVPARTSPTTCRPILWANIDHTLRFANVFDVSYGVSLKRNVGTRLAHSSGQNGQMSRSVLLEDGPSQPMPTPACIGESQ